MPCDGQAYIEGGNQYVLSDTTVPDYTLNKNNQSIANIFLTEVSACDGE